MKNLKKWQVVIVSTVLVTDNEVFASNLAYNEAKKMASDYNGAGHFGSIFKAVRADEAE